MATIGDACMQWSSTDGTANECPESSPFGVFTPPTSPKAVAGGPKHKLVTEGDIQVCRLNHTRTIVSKIMNSKYLRRWETHKIVLDHSEIRSTTPVGFMEQFVPYSTIEDVHIVSRWDIGNKFCIRITIPDGSILLQANNAYLRDQWLYSIQWKKHTYRYEKLLKNARRPEVLVKEIKEAACVSVCGKRDFQQQRCCTLFRISASSVQWIPVRNQVAHHLPSCLPDGFHVQGKVFMTDCCFLLDKQNGSLFPLRAT